MKKLKVLLKRKKIVLLLFIPFMLAMQCEDDTLNSGFETEYIIHNDSSTDLIFFTELDTQIPIESKTSYSFASDLNQTTDAIKPSDSFVFTQVKLFKEEDGSFILVYEQAPLEDSLWVFSEPSENRFEYKLVITDALIN